MKAVLTIPEPKYKSELERQYAAQLELQCRAREIISWDYEVVTWKLAELECRYTPDFRLLVPVGRYSLDGYTKFDGCKVVFDEVKGHWTEAAKIRVKVAMDKFPEYEWRVVTGKKRRGQYVFEVIPAKVALGRNPRI